MVIEAMQARLDSWPDAMRVRRQTVEHVFGTLSRAEPPTSLARATSAAAQKPFSHSLCPWRTFSSRGNLPRVNTSSRGAPGPCCLRAVSIERRCRAADLSATKWRFPRPPEAG
jgi:hypothetical protein